MLPQPCMHLYDAESRKFTGKERDSESVLDTFGQRFRPQVAIPTGGQLRRLKVETIKFLERE